jgi:hypothetical protein
MNFNINPIDLLQYTCIQCQDFLSKVLLTTYAYKKFSHAKDVKHDICKIISINGRC